MRSVRVLLFVGLLSASGSAAVIPIAQSRSITASAFSAGSFGSDSHSANLSAPDLSAFVQTVSVSARGLGDGNRASASASQNSRFTTSGIEATGEVIAAGATNLGTLETGSSLLDMSFQIDAPATGTLSGSISGFIGYVRFEGPGGQIFGTTSTVQSFDVPLQLAPGTYRLTAESRVEGSGRTTNKFIANVNLVPEPSTVALFAFAAIAFRRRALAAR